jgi:hypothetical protein
MDRRSFMIKHKSGVTVSITRVTPRMADKWLKMNARNRSLNGNRVTLLVKELRAGNWKLNGDAIRFYDDGGLADGQHRLKACVISGVTFETLLVRNLSLDCMHTIDQGRSKQRHDVLQMCGFKNTTKLSASLRFVSSYLQHGDPTKSRHYQQHIYSTQVMLDLLEKYPDLNEAAQEIGRLYPTAQRLLTPGSATALLWIMRMVDYKDAHEFFQDLSLGANLPAGDPVHLLRERIMRDRSQHVRGEVRDLSQKWMNLCAVAWNLRRDGRKCKRLNLPSVWPGLK